MVQVFDYIKERKIKRKREICLCINVGITLKCNLSPTVNVLLNIPLITINNDIQNGIRIERLI